MENVELAPQTEAQEVLRLQSEVTQRIEKLKAQRTAITEALVALGVEKRGVGRPAGVKRARKPKHPEVASA